MDCEPVQVCRDEIRAAAKPHICSQCHGTIQTGEQYHVFHMLFEEEWRDYKECCDCRDLVNELQSSGELVAFCGLWEDVSEGHVDDMLKFMRIRHRRGGKIDKRMVECLFTALVRELGIEDDVNVSGVRRWR